jgi:hypothetical protein
MAAHRGCGKSFVLLLLALERSLSAPFQNCRIGAPLYEQVVEITHHNLQAILHHANGACPEDMMPVVKEHQLQVYNPAWGEEGKEVVSTVSWFGCNKRTADNVRGRRSNFVALDEVGYVDEAEYVLSAVLGGTFIGQDDPRMVLSSTPPRSSGHPFCSRLVPDAAAEGRLVKITVDDNPDFGPADRQVLLQMCNNDPGSAAWRREALCETVSDAQLAAVPAFIKFKDRIVQEGWTQPAHYYPLESADLGFKDYNAVVYGWIDYQKQKLVIKEESFMNAVSTRTLCDAVRKTETKLFANCPERHMTRRWADGTAQQLYDMAIEHRLLFETPKAGEKWEKWAGLANLDTYCQVGRLIIDPACKNLIFQLESATKNTKLTDLEKIPLSEFPDPDRPVAGHWDALWALAYLAHQASQYFYLNPFPSYSLDGEDVFHTPEYTKKRIQKGAITVTHNKIAYTRHKA